MGCSGPLLLAVLVVMCSVPPVASEVKDTAHHRQVRDTSYWVDLVVLLDWATYRSWYGRTQTTLSPEERKSKALDDMKRYFTLVIKEVSDLYSSLGTTFRLHFRPVAFYVETQDTSQWVTLTASGQADSDSTIHRVVDWLKTSTNSSQYDHAVLFTGTDMATDNEGHTTGRGTTGSMCVAPTYDSVSVVEDRGAFQSVFTLAHELGHSFNAIHDGVNGCSLADRYIMASNTADVTADNQLHPWRFSTCTRNEISAFVNSMSPTQFSRCLEKSLPQDSDVPDVTGLLPGQLYDRDTQCQHLYGDQAAFCFFGDLSAICTQMPCRDPSRMDSQSCNVHLAATGTSCGNKMWCQGGACVYSSDAPALESCVTDETVLVNGMSCSRMAVVQPALCYDVEVFTKCCRSCQQADTGKRGCPWGNKKSGCSPEVCHKIHPDGEVADESCCDTCAFDRLTWSCQDVNTIDGKTCSMAVNQHGLQGCYNLTLAFYCCAACQNLRRLDRGQGCEYGDRLLQGCRPPSKGSRDQCDFALCCHTCNTEPPTDAGHLQRPLSLMTLVLLAVLITSPSCLRSCYQL